MEGSTRVMTAAAAGGAGRPPGGGGGKDDRSGHYAPYYDGPVMELKGIRMASGRPHVLRRRPQGRPRSYSLPGIGTDSDFQRTFHSVMQSGILSQPEMRRRGIGYQPSHDGRKVGADRVSVTRVPAIPEFGGQTGASRASMENFYHGALSVALEREQGELSTRRLSEGEVRANLSLEQRFDLLRMSSEDAGGVLRALRSREPLQLTPIGRQQVESRLHHTFLVMSPYRGESRGQAFEYERPSILPRDVGRVLVPEEHRSAAMQVRRYFRARGIERAPIETVPSVQGMQPRYHTQRGDTVAIRGVMAPAYHVSVSQQIRRQGGSDIHLVRAPERAPLGQHRPRSFSMPPKRE